MREIKMTCDRCGKQKTAPIANYTGEGFDWVCVDATLAYQPRGSLFKMDEVEVCTKCIRILRAMLSHQVRRWQQNADTYRNTQLDKWEAEDGRR